MNTIPPELQGVLASDPEMLSGAICFIGIRVPVKCLLDTIMYGGTVGEFMENWPGVPLRSALKVLEWQGNQSQLLLGIAS